MSVFISPRGVSTGYFVLAGRRFALSLRGSYDSVLLRGPGRTSNIARKTDLDVSKNEIACHVIPKSLENFEAKDESPMGAEGPGGASLRIFS